MKKINFDSNNRWIAIWGIVIIVIMVSVTYRYAKPIVGDRNDNLAGAIKGVEITRAPNPIISSSTPASVKIGSILSISGKNFISGSNTIKVSKENSNRTLQTVGYIYGATSTNGSEISLVVPPSISTCANIKACKAESQTTLAVGKYLISVLVEKRESNTAPVEILYPFSNVEGGRVRSIVFNDQSKIDEALSNGCTIQSRIASWDNMTVLSCATDVAFRLRLFNEDEKRNELLSVVTNEKSFAPIVTSHPFNLSGKGVKVAVIDSGYDTAHVELSNSLVLGKNFSDPANPNDLTDNLYHGSIVSGVLTANGARAVAKGMAPDADVIMAKVSEGLFFNDSFTAGAMDWLISLNVPIDILNLSYTKHSDHLNVNGDCDETVAQLNDKMMSLEAANIQRIINRGVVVLAGAGNIAGKLPGFPACLKNVIAVGGIGLNGSVAGSVGKAVDIVAPFTEPYAIASGGGYTLSEGTSLSAPYVSGVIALIKEKHPEYNVEQIKDALFYTAKYLETTPQSYLDEKGRKKNDITGYGFVDACKAVLYDLLKTPAENEALIGETCRYHEVAVFHMRGGGATTWEYGVGTTTNVIPVNGNTTWESGVSSPFSMSFDQSSRTLKINLNNAGEKVWNIPSDLFPYPTNGVPAKYRVKISAQARPSNSETSISADLTDVFINSNSGIYTFADIIGATSTPVELVKDGFAFHNGFIASGKAKFTWEPTGATTSPKGSYSQMFVRFYKDLTW